MSSDYKLFKSRVLMGKKKTFSNIVEQNSTTCGAPSAAGRELASNNIYRYMLTIVCNQKLHIAPSFDDFYQKVATCFSLDGIELVYSFYELQPTTFKLHIHAVVLLKKDNPNAFRFNYFPKIFKTKGYKYDFKKIEDENHCINCFNYEKSIPQQYIRSVHTKISQVSQLLHSKITKKALNECYKMLASPPYTTSLEPWQIAHAFDSQEKNL